MHTITNFLMFYLLVGFILSIIPIVFKKVKNKYIFEWIVYCTLFYPLYILAFLLKEFIIVYEKYIERILK